MNKTYGIVLMVLAGIVVTLSVSYYFILFLPSQKFEQIKQEKQSFLFKKQTECMQICSVLYNAEKNKTQLGPSDFVVSPKYAYNQSKNACFYSFNVIMKVDENSIDERSIINCQTNERVVPYLSIDNKNVYIKGGVTSEEEYDRLEREYFGD